MKSARRQKRFATKKRRFVLRGAFLLIFGLVLAFAYFFIYFNTRYWNGSDKLSFVFPRANGDIGVTVLDPKLGEKTTLIIPGDTEVDVARNYWTLRLKNVWQLGINEKLDGALLSGTVTKSFLFPVFLWTNEDGGSLSRFIFSRKTNIPLGDRLAAGLFMLNIQAIDKTEIDLGKSQFLRKEVLNDGRPGYRISGHLGNRLTVYFSDDDFSDRNLKI